MDIVAIRGKTLTFLGEWVSSSLMLLFEPTEFIPPPGKKPPKGAALTSTTRKHIGFAASAVFVAITIFQIVARRSNTGSVWDSVKESLPFSLLVVGSWVLWSGFLALILKAFGGTQSPMTNVLFGVRALATFYVISMLVGTMAFLALGNQWAVFQWAELLISFGLYTVYCPLIFCEANDLDGLKFKVVAALFFLLSIFKSAVGFGAMTWNPYVVPLAPPPPPPPRVNKEYAPALGNLVIEGGYGSTGVHDAQVTLTKPGKGPGEFRMTVHYGPLWCGNHRTGVIPFVDLEARYTGSAAWQPVGQENLKLDAACPKTVECSTEHLFTREIADVPEQLRVTAWSGCW